MNKKTEDDDLRIISGSIKKLLQLDEQERKIQKAQKKEIETIHSVMDRLDDRGINGKIAKNEEATMLLQQAKELFANLRSLLKH